MPHRNNEIREWLRAQLAAAGHGSRQRLARHLGLARPDAITRMLNTDPKKEGREIKAREYELMREFFAQENGGNDAESTNTVDGVDGEISLLGRRVPYGGTVRAGGFLPVDEYFSQDDGDHLVPPSVVWHPDFPDVQQHAWLVHGDSLDLVGIREGMWIVAALYGDYREKIGEIDNGQFVVVERSRLGGSEIERTVKEAQFSRKGMRLIPRSSNPVHKEFFIPFDHNADGDTETVRVLAVVLSAVTDYSRRIRAAIAADMPADSGPGKKVRSRMANA